MILSFYVQRFKSRYDLLREEFFLLFSLLLYCVSIFLPVFRHPNFSFYLLISAVPCYFLSLILNVLGLNVGLVLSLVVSYFYIAQKHCLLSEILWFQGCVLSIYLSLLISLWSWDVVKTKKEKQNQDIKIKLKQLQQEKQNFLKKLREAEETNLQIADMCFYLETKSLETEKSLNNILEEKNFFEKQVRLLSEQKLFWISNYDDLHRKFLLRSSSEDKFLIEENNAGELHRENDELIIRDSISEDCEREEKSSEMLSKENTEQQVIPNISSEDVNLLSLEVKRFQGLYNQLRDQFEEKKYQLQVTRQQLFRLEETIVVEKREKHVLLREEVKEFKDLRCFSYAENKIVELEEEVIYLEELVSHILLK